MAKTGLPSVSKAHHRWSGNVCDAPGIKAQWRLCVFSKHIIYLFRQTAKYFISPLGLEAVCCLCLLHRRNSWILSISISGRRTPQFSSRDARQAIVSFEFTSCDNCAPYYTR